VSSSHTASSSKAQIAQLTAFVEACDLRIPQMKADLEQLEKDRHTAAKQLRELKESIRFPLPAILITYSRYSGCPEKSRRPTGARLTPTQIVIPGYGENSERRFHRGNGEEIGKGYLGSTRDVVELVTDEQVAGEQK
jgi:hypothetical protein